MKNPILLGVNIDHVATLRQQRKTIYPDPLQAAREAEAAGADSITLHLREDRRHIQNHDVIELKKILKTRMNLEMAVMKEMLSFAETIRPHDCCLVPERREELTTEGGLNVLDQEDYIHQACSRLAKYGIRVSLFIDPDEKQIAAAMRCKAPIIELHTGCYADAQTASEQQRELIRIQTAAKFAKQAGLQVNAGHGLNCDNVQPIAAIPEITELNIGHAIVARAVFIGIKAAVEEMKQLLMAMRQ